MSSGSAYCELDLDRRRWYLCCFADARLLHVSRRYPAAHSVCIPSTIRESVPNVSEAFRPTARVSGTCTSSRPVSIGCEGWGAAEVKEGSRKGSWSDKVVAIAINVGGNQETRSMLKDKMRSSNERRSRLLQRQTGRSNPCAQS